MKKAKNKLVPWTKNQLAIDCDQIMKAFDEDCSITDASSRITQKEHDKFYEALEKAGTVDPDDLAVYENDVRGIGFAFGYLFGSGELVTQRNKQSVRAVRELTKLLEKAKQ